MTSKRFHRDDAGFTIAEMAVVMLIFSIVAVIAFNFLDETTRLTRRSTDSVQVEREAQLALRQVTQDLRAANPIGDKCSVGDYDTCLSFEVKRPSDAKPDCITKYIYRVSGTQLLQSLSDADCATSRTWTDRPVVKVANNLSTQPPFQYFDRLGKQISLATACTNSPTTACVKEARSIKVRVLVTFNNQPGTQTLDLSSVASLRNSR